MDLHQTKLSKEEWSYIESRINDDEKLIINMIKDGFYNRNIHINKNKSFLSFIKLERTSDRETYIYNEYFYPEMKNFIEGTKASLKQHLNKSEMIRFKNTENQIKRNRDIIYEYIIIHFAKKLYKYREKKDNKWNYYYYTLSHLLKNKIYLINSILVDTLKTMMHKIKKEVDLYYIFKNGKKMIEENTNLFQYKDKTLFNHQKDIFNIFQEYRPSLTLYMAPTGTGKTLTPIGLSEKYKIIFVCAARHVGVSLAKNAINCKKKIAFAFGCQDKNDIRLHYFAAKTYSTNLKTGKIFNINNLDGEKVEIIICDSKSYLHAQEYMLLFNKKEEMITYWDEPTISLDYDEHPLHEYFHQNWKENKIPQMVLSSATLPDIPNVIENFKSKFENSVIHEISSYDFKKSITIINKESKIETPHTLYESYNDIQLCCQYIEKNKTLLRYIELKTIIDFMICNDKYFTKETFHSTFVDIEDLTMESIKLYYIRILKTISESRWKEIYHKSTQELYKSTIKITTSDAYTMTNGPSIYFADNLDKISKYCIYISNIPKEIITNLTKKLQYNKTIHSKLDKLYKSLEDNQEDSKSNKLSNESRGGEVIKEIKKNISNYELSLKKIELEEEYIPNTKKHMDMMNIEKELRKHVFRSDITENNVESIMDIQDIDNNLKILLMMGIGIFSETINKEYTRIMKELAQQQKLFMIISSTDYIYGTNYQFCHCYIGSDLVNLTQDKMIQTMGRVGRGNIQQNYSVRFRNNDMIERLFIKREPSKEDINMNKIFS